MSTNNQDAMIAVKQFLDKKPVLKQGRVVFAKKEETFKLPYLNDVQVDSFKSFLQENVEPLERKNIGFQNLFTSSFPFVSNDGKVKLEFISYVVEEKTYSVNTAIENDRNYTVPIKAKIRLILEEIGEIKEQEIFICDLPYMTDQGTFIINGVERVVVSQIHRSPGVIFDYNNRALIHHSRIIPNKGPWLEFEILKEVIYVRIDRKTRILLTFFLRALGFESNESIVKLFFEKENISIKDKTAEELKDLLLGRYVFENIDLSSLVEEKEEVVEKVVEKKTKKTKKTRKNSKEESVRKNLLIVAGSIIDEEIIDNLIKLR